MANGNRLSMSYGRRFLAIGLAAVGLFVVSYGIGLGNPGIIAVGVAVGVLGPALLIFTAVRSTGRQYIFGTAHVYSASPPPSSGMVGRCELHLSVFAAGIDGVAVRVLDPAVPVSKWPDDGATLPVEVVANNPRKVRVLWDKVVTHAQAAGEDLYPQYVEDLPPDLDDDFDEELPPDEYLDDDHLPPVPAGPPPTPPPNMPTASPTVAAAGMDFAPVAAPLLVPPAAAPPPGAPTTKVVAAPAASPSGPATAPPAQAEPPAHDGPPVPVDDDEPAPAGLFGRDVRAERDRHNRAYVSETYEPDDDSTPEYWRDPDDEVESEASPATATRAEPMAPAAPPAQRDPDDREAIRDPDLHDDTADSDTPGDRGDGGGVRAAGGADRDGWVSAPGRGDRDGWASSAGTDDHDDPRGSDDRDGQAGSDDRDDRDEPTNGDDRRGSAGHASSAWSGGAGWASRRGGPDDSDGSGMPMAAQAGGPPVSLPLPRRRPSPHLRRPSPRQRKASDSETGEPRASSGTGGINPVYVAEAPSEPPPDWPLSPHPDAQPAQPVRPESRPEPDYTEVVSGTVEAGSRGYGEVLSGSIVDDHGYSDRSETDRMTFDRSSFRALEIDVPDTGPNGFGPNRSASRAGDDDDPFNVVPLRVDRDRAGGAAAAASNGTAPRTDHPAPADEPDDEPDDDPDDDPTASTDTETARSDTAAAETAETDPAAAADTDDDPAGAERSGNPEAPGDSEDFAAGSFLAAPSASLSSLGSGGFSVTLFVRELSRSVTFYRDVLGLPEVDTGKHSAVLARGDSRILLKRVNALEPIDRRVVHLNLEVPDVQAAYEDLKTKGVEFVHRPRVVSHGEQFDLWAAAFRDPDGHAIALTHWEIRR